MIRLTLHSVLCLLRKMHEDTAYAGKNTSYEYGSVIKCMMMIHITSYQKHIPGLLYLVACS